MFTILLTTTTTYLYNLTYTTTILTTTILLLLPTTTTTYYYYYSLYCPFFLPHFSGGPDGNLFFFNRYVLLCFVIFSSICRYFYALSAFRRTLFSPLPAHLSLCQGVIKSVMTSGWEVAWYFCIPHYYYEELSLFFFVVFCFLFLFLFFAVVFFFLVVDL